VGEVSHGSLLQLLLEHCDFLNIDISQGSLVTRLRCGGIFKYELVANLPVSLPVKEIPTCPFSGTTRVSRYQKGITNLDFTEARHSEWQWHQLGRMQVCITLQTDNHASTPPLSFLQAGCPSCCPTNSVKALKANKSLLYMTVNFLVTVTVGV